MKTINELEREIAANGSLDMYREIGKNNPDIAALVSMIDKQSAIIVNLIETMAKNHAKTQQKAA